MVDAEHDKTVYEIERWVSLMKNIRFMQFIRSVSLTVVSLDSSKIDHLCYNPSLMPK